MSEYTIGHLAVASILGVGMASLLYMYGGRKHKIIRRLGSALVLALIVNLVSLAFNKWNPWLLGIIPLLFGGFSMGYGANIGYLKFIRRFLYALGVCSSGLLMCFIFGGNAWLILPVHLVVGFTSIWLGTRNPIHAAAEETFICLLLNIGLVMYPFVV